MARGDAARLLRPAAKLFVNSSPGTPRPGPICHFPAPASAAIFHMFVASYARRHHLDFGTNWEDSVVSVIASLSAKEADSSKVLVDRNDPIYLTVG